MTMAQGLIADQSELYSPWLKFPNRFDLVVIGSGPAGQKAAIAAAKLGKRVAIVERNFTVGGLCLFEGTIPSKTLREAAVYLSGLRERELYGSAYRVKERITIEDLAFRTRRVMERESNVIRDQLLRNYVEIVHGEGRFLDQHHIEVRSPAGNRILETDKVIIAVGSRPVRPENIKFDDRRIVDSNGLLRLPRIPRTLVIVGAGIVGTEYATIFRLLGTRVTLIDQRENPHFFLDVEIAEALRYHMRQAGIILRFGEKVTAVEPIGEEGPVTIELASGKRLMSEAVMLAAGRIGATDRLNLEAVGIQPDERGRIPVNEYFQTPVPNIYAVGDVIGSPSLAATAMEQGRLAAYYAFGVDAGKMNPILPYGIYTVPEVAMVGPTEQELTKQGIPYEVGVAHFRELARAQIIGFSTGLLKLLFHQETKQLLAVHIFGEHAAELVHIGQTVIALGGSIEYLRDAVFNYPTLAEAYKIAALDGLNRLLPFADYELPTKSTTTAPPASHQLEKFPVTS